MVNTNKNFNKTEHDKPSNRFQYHRENDKYLLDKIINMVKKENYILNYSQFLTYIYRLSFVGGKESILHSIDYLFQNRTSTVSKNMFIQDLINLIYIDYEKPVMSKYGYLRYEKTEETPKEFKLLFNHDMKPKHVTDEILTLIQKTSIEELIFILKVLDNIIPNAE